MNRLQANMVFRNNTDSIDFRIVYISYDYSDTVCIELNNSKALPYCDSTLNIEAKLGTNELEILENDPYFKIIDERVISKKFLEIRDNSYKYIKDLCSTINLLDLCIECKRGKLINDIKINFGVTKKTIYKNMRKFLQGGMTKNSLLPSPSKPKFPKHLIKTGRKRTITEGTGIIIDDTALLHIRNIYEKYFLKVDGSTLRQTYHELLYQYYSYLTIENNVEVRKILDDDKIPTFRQFTYHINKIRNIKDEIINKIGERKYHMTERPTLSKEDINILAPGQLYEIDSTVSDLYLVSDFSRNVVVGKAVLYIIIDVYSRLITGFYTGLEESSWIAAMMAYVNMNENKVEFCKQYDIVISEDQWPSHGIPSKINADKGETISKASDELVQHLGITIENNPAYHPDMKGIVERWFRTINDYLQRYVPGGVRKDHQERGGKDYRKNAVLNIKEFNQLIIKFILSYNNAILQSYNMSKDMIDNKVIPTPINLWTYGSTKNLLLTKSIPKEKMILTLMPKYQASIQRGGICFKGLFYSCETAIRENWFLRISKGPKKVDIALDPRNLNKIYIYDKKTMNFETCNMLEKSLKDYKDISLDDLIKIRSKEAQLKKLNNTENISLLINSHYEIEDIINKAVRESKQLSSLTDSTLKNIPRNKKIEKIIMRKEEYFDLDARQGVKNSSILKLDKYKNKSLDSYNSQNTSEPSFDEHMQKYKDDANSLLESIILQNNLDD